MATRNVSPAATGTGTGSFANPWTVDQARLLAAPGDTIIPLGGTYPASFPHVFDNTDGRGVSGVAGNPITWSAGTDDVTFAGTSILHGLSYVDWTGLTYMSDSRTWILGGTGVAAAPFNHMTWTGCTFDQSAWSRFSYNGILARGSEFVTFDGCTFNDWLGGDAIHFYDSRRLLFKGNDFSQSRCGHACINLDNCSRSVIHGNYFRNSLDRALLIQGTTNGDDVIVQWNLCIDCDWDPDEAHPYDGTDWEEFRGGYESVRFLSRRGIFRFNILARSNLGRTSTRNSCLNISFYEADQAAAFMRIYHNIIYNGARSGVLISSNSEIGTNFDDRDIRLQNNIISENGEQEVSIFAGALQWRTYRFISNIISDTGKEETIYNYYVPTPQQMTVDTAQARFPVVFSGNNPQPPDVEVTDFDPDFDDVTILGQIDTNPENYSIADLDTVFDKMQITDGSPGEDSGTHLAEVYTTVTNSTIVTLTDAIPFTGGWGLIARDQISFDSMTDYVEVVERLSDKQLRLSAPVSVTAGDKVYLNIQDTTVPNIGIPSAVQVPPDVDPPLLSTDDETPEENELAIRSAFPTGFNFGSGNPGRLVFPQANPRLQKFITRVNLSGAETSPILSGLGATVSLQLNSPERLLSWRVFNDDFEKQLAIDDDQAPTTEIVFGTDTDSDDSSSGKRNFIEWVTTAGTSVRQFFVKDIPSEGNLYLGNQEAQAAGAVWTIRAGEPVSFGIDILPSLGDEFFGLHEYTGNRFSNTLRNWGGAFTGQVWLGQIVIINERYLGHIHGYYWDAPAAGTHIVVVRIRAAAGSPYFIDIEGTIRIEYTL
jgi:hypothetical protein